MSALFVISALAAQVGTPPASAKPADATEGPKVGHSTYLDVEAGAGYSTNPFLSANDHGGRGFGRVSLHAVHTRVSERTTTLLSAYAQNTTFTGKYGSQQSFDINGRHDAAVSERLRLFADADFAYDKGGQLDTRIIGLPNVPLPPGTTLPPSLVLPGNDFLTVRGRQYRASGHVGGQWALGPLDSLNISSGLEHVVFKSGNLDTRYTTVPVSIGYNRKVSARATVGAQVTASRTDYNGPSNYEVVSPQVTGLLQLSETLTFRGAAGASFVRTDSGIATRHSSGLSANATLCSVTERGQLCARAAVDQASATAAGPSKSTSIGVDYSRRLDADQTIQFSLAADHYSTPTSFVTGQTFSRANYFRAVANYSRRLGGRLFAGVDVSARKVTQSGPDPDADFSGSFFVRYRFGDLQ